MPQDLLFNLDEPGTFVYTGALSTKGFRLNRFVLSLKGPENRSVFAADPRGYMRGFDLSDEEMTLVEARDWTGLLRAGGHLQAILKLAAAVGQDLWAIGAHNAGMSVEEIIEACPRHTHGLPGQETR